MYYTYTYIYIYIYQDSNPNPEVGRPVGLPKMCLHRFLARAALWSLGAHESEVHK